MLRTRSRLSFMIKCYAAGFQGWLRKSWLKAIELVAWHTDVVDCPVGLGSCLVSFMSGL